MSEPKLKKEATDCYHCGEPYELEDAIHHDGHPFCCTGCKSVYDILKEADLCDFYSLEERTARVKSVDSRKYLPLDNPEIAESFLEFNHEGLAKVSFLTPAIHCSSCIWLLEHLHKINPGIARAMVNFPKREVTVSFYTDAITLREVAVLLESIGYPPQLEQRNKQKKGDRDLVTRLAVAGFCFGNSMLLSLPDYLKLDYQIPTDYKAIFAYINLLFALPVFFFSATVYFESAWKGLKHRFINIDVPISIGILALFLRSLYEIVVLGHLGFVDSLAGLVFFLLIGRWYQHKTYQALSFDRDVASYFPMAVTVLTEGKEQTIPIHQLREGDEVLLRHHELIPADAYLVSGHANIDYSFVTGESIPTTHTEGELLYAGGRQMGGPIVVRLKKRVNNSHMTKLWNQSPPTQQAPGLQNLSDQISKYFTAAILLIATAGAITWYFIDASHSFSVFTAVLIVACPCASALAIPFTYGHILRVYGQNGLYLKNANIVEKISKVGHIVFDKTGTLTLSLPEHVRYQGRPLTDREKSMVYAATSNSIHPLSTLIARFLKGNPKLPVDFFDEYTGKGIVARFGVDTVQIGEAAWLGQLKSNGQGTRVYVSINRDVCGYFTFEAAYRTGIFETLENLKQHAKMSLLSGDTDGEKKRLSPYFDVIKFRQSPTDKRDYINGQGSIHAAKTMMVGDGLNDAGALKASDVGISISDDIYQFSPSSDGILASESLPLFASFIQLSRQAVRIVIIALIISLGYNIIGLALALMGVLSPMVCAILMPTSSVTVVGFITLMVNHKAQVLLF